MDRIILKIKNIHKQKDITRNKIKFSEIIPRDSMIAVHHRFTYRDETNRKINKIR